MRFTRATLADEQHRLRSFDTGTVVVETDGILVINPDRLLKGVRTAFQERCEGIDHNRKKLLTDRLRRLFEREARAARI